MESPAPGVPGDFWLFPREVDPRRLKGLLAQALLGCRSCPLALQPEALPGGGWSRLCQPKRRSLRWHPPAGGYFAGD